MFISMVAIFVAYVGMIWYRYGVLPSISESYYRLPKDQKILFTFFCWLFVTPAIILGDSVFMFVAGTAIFFVGAASAFKMRLTGQVHIVGAVVGILCGLLHIVFVENNYPLSIITASLVISIMISGIKNSTWWIEIVVFTAICITLGLKVL